MTHTPNELAALLDRHRLSPSRALGQNFVIDPNTVRRIARLAEVGPGDRVVEIGAGLGSLTLALLETGAQVLAIERDRRLVPVLRSVLDERLGDAGPSTDRHVVQVIEADALAYPWEDLGPGPVTLVANLPYNVATPLVLDLLSLAPNIDRMLIMVQREAAERMAATPGSKIYGIPSVKVAFDAHAEVVAKVSANVFLPRPKVESALLALRRRPPPESASREIVFSLVDDAFGQRRKMLRRSLADRVSPAQFLDAGVDSSRRAEQLDLAAWVRLARVVAR